MIQGELSRHFKVDSEGGESLWGIGLQEKITVDTIAECNIEMIAFGCIHHLYLCKVPLIGKVFRNKNISFADDLAIHRFVKFKMRADPVQHDPDEE
ncbi:MAG: hypothetical protein AB2792_21360 [Candidatus Thiodiazotropha sp.]